MSILSAPGTSAKNSAIFSYTTSIGARPVSMPIGYPRKIGIATAFLRGYDGARPMPLPEPTKGAASKRPTIADYRCYLSRRGLSPRTIDEYVAYARRFYVAHADGYDRARAEAWIAVLPVPTR